MKAKKNIRISAIFLIVFIISSCSKERIDKETGTEYSSLDEFYINNELPEQIFIIDTIPGDTIVGMHGTKIWGVPKEIFMKKSTYEDITYPYNLKLTEAYIIKDMIFARHQNIAQNRVLYSSGNIRFRAFKDEDELELKEHCGLNFLAPAETSDASMELFYGFTTETTNDWNKDVLQAGYLFSDDDVTFIATNSYGYKAKTAKMGWVNISYKYPGPSQGTINFAIEGTNTNLIDIYIIFNDMHSYIKATNLQAVELPEDEPITVFAIAKTTSDEMYYYKEDFTTSSQTNIELEMIPATEDEILTIMGTL